MELLRAEKPVIVSMGAYAASGGYYISCPADVIVADRMTLTGSIGVYGMYLDAGAALKDKLGITFDGVRSNTSADMGFMRPLTPSNGRSSCAAWIRFTLPSRATWPQDATCRWPKCSTSRRARLVG